MKNSVHTRRASGLRIEMPRGLDIDRHRAAPVSAFDHLQAERAGEFEILPERPHRTLLTNSGTTEGRRRGRAARTARQLRLIGAPAMLDAIREPRVHGLTAEMEVGHARMHHRPAPDTVVKA